MATYNHTKTAYKRFDSSTWYLIPDGKKRAPLFSNGPCLGAPSRYNDFTDEHVNLITNRDRIILLESVAGGCYEQTWYRMKNALQARSKKNYHILMKYTGFKE